MVATAAASGTTIMRSTAVPRKLGSTRWRPIPSIREPTAVRTSPSSSRHAGKNAEFSGSATQTPVRRPVYARYRAMVAEVPPVPAVATIHSGSGYRSSDSWAKIDSAMLLLPRQSVARSAKVNWSM